MTTKISQNEISSISSAHVTTALGYTPYNATNPNGYITSSGTAAAISGTYGGTLTSSQVTTALGFTPYNATNPSSYITSSGPILSTSISGTVATSKGGTGLAASGESGGVLISDGTNWTTAVITGEVSFFARSTAPAGWLKSNGAAISRTTYAGLFAAIGTYYGAGDGSTTFNIPDLRGEFLRGWDDGRGVDSGRTFGTAQGQDWKTLYLQDAGQNSASNYTHDVIGIKGLTKIGVNDGTLNLFLGYWSNNSAHLNGYWGGEEIRPRNVALLACIKY